MIRSVINLCFFYEILFHNFKFLSTESYISQILD